MLVAPMVHRSALKTLGTRDIAARRMVMAREIKAKTEGKAKEDQVGGIEDPGAAARLASRVGRVTMAPREKIVKWFPMGKAGDTPPRRKERSVRDLTTSSMTL